MALIKCSECGHEISDTAKVCPKCGYKNKRSSLGKGCLITTLLLLSFMVFLFVLGSLDTEDDPKRHTDVASTISNADLGHVCRAAIAVVMVRDPSIIGVDRVSGGKAYISYSRPNDGTIWKYRCRVEGNRVVWSTVDIDGPGTGPGRWRTHQMDETITFKIDGAKVSIKMIETDGTVSNETFSLH